MDEIMFTLPPHVVNEAGIVLPQSQTPDWGFTMLKIADLHAAGFRGKGFKVAVIDTGVDHNHPDLKRAIFKRINVTQEPYQATNGHGTGCAAIIAARDNETGIIGVAPDCEIVAIKALNESGGGSLSQITQAIDLAIAEGVDVINMSLGTIGNSPSLHDRVKKAVSAGIIVVCAAGNAGSEDSVMYPAKYPEAFAVGAINQDRKVSAFSSRGWEVNVAAPGERILTAWNKRSYAKVSGTSFASPYVAGLMVLFLEMAKELKASIKINHELLEVTAIDIETPGEDTLSGHGLVNPRSVFDKIADSAMEDNEPDTGEPEKPGNGPKDEEVDPKKYQKVLDAFMDLATFLADLNLISGEIVIDKRFDKNKLTNE